MGLWFKGANGCCWLAGELKPARQAGGEGGGGHGKCLVLSYGCFMVRGWERGVLVGRGVGKIGIMQ